RIGSSASGPPHHDERTSTFHVAPTTGGRSRSPAKIVKQTSQLQEKHAGRVPASDAGGGTGKGPTWNNLKREEEKRQHEREDWAHSGDSDVSERPPAHRVGELAPVKGERR